MTEGGQPIETGNFPTSAVGGQPFGGNEGGLTRSTSGSISSVDVQPEGSAGPSGAAGENSSGQGAKQEARQNGPETGQKDGKEAAAGQSEAHQKIAKQAEEGMQSAQSGKPDGAREALQEIAQEPAIQELLITIFSGTGSPVLEQAAQEIFRSLTEGKNLSQKDKEELGRRINSFLEKISKTNEGKTVAQMITKLKESPNAEIRALGYDIELLQKQRRIDQIDQAIQTYQQYLERSDLPDEKRRQIEAEKSRLEEEKKKVEEEIEKVKEERKQIKNGNGEDIPNQVDAKLKPLAQEIAEAAGLTDEEKKALVEDPILMMAESFGRVIEPCIEIDKSGNITVNEENQKKLNQFIESLKNQGIVNEAQAHKFSEEFNSLVKRLQNLAPEEKKLLRQIKIEKGAKKGLQVGLGILGVLALLAYMSAKAGSGGGRGRG
jgi:chromosome segregation ATPase